MEGASSAGSIDHTFMGASGEIEVPFSGRFQGLSGELALGLWLPVATGFRARLLGLAWLDREAAGDGLIIHRCASVHTFGMRFELDLHFLDRGGEPLRSVEAVGPGRLVGCRGASTVVEVVPRKRTGAGGEIGVPRP